MNLLQALIAVRRAGAGHAVIRSYHYSNYYVIRYADVQSIPNFDTIRHII